MTSALPARTRSHFFAALLFGCWAAAIAVAPSLTAKALFAAPPAVAGTVWWTIQRPARWVALFFAAALLLPPLPIPIGNSGPHPSMVFAALGVFCGVLWLSEWRVPATGLNAAFVVIRDRIAAVIVPACFAFTVSTMSPPALRNRQARDPTG